MAQDFDHVDNVSPASIAAHLGSVETLDWLASRGFIPRTNSGLGAPKG